MSDLATRFGAPDPAADHQNRSGRETASETVCENPPTTPVSGCSIRRDSAEEHMVSDIALLLCVYAVVSLACAAALRLLSMLPRRANREQAPTRDWWTAKPAT